jgi:hypothetical protein
VSVTADRFTSGGIGGGRDSGFGARAPTATLAPPPPPAPSIDFMAPLSPAATAQELGDLFEYKLNQPVTS